MAYWLPKTGDVMHVWFRIFLIVFGLFLILDTFFAAGLSNMNLGVIMPLIIGLPLLILGIFYGPITGWMSGYTLGKWIKWLMVSVYGLFFICFFICTSILIYYGNAKPDENADVMIVLGAGIHGEQLTLSLAARLNTAVEYLEANPKTTVIVSGGQGSGEDISEALAMQRYLLRRGVAEERIIMEDASTSTVENFRFSRGIIEDIYPGDPHIVFVTSGFHVLRAGLVARAEGVEAQGLGAPSLWYLYINDYMREFAAIVQYWISGKI